MNDDNDEFNINNLPTEREIIAALPYIRHPKKMAATTHCGQQVEPVSYEFVNGDIYKCVSCGTHGHFPNNPKPYLVVSVFTGVLAIISGISIETIRFAYGSRLYYWLGYRYSDWICLCLISAIAAVIFLIMSISLHINNVDVKEFVDHENSLLSPIPMLDVILAFEKIEKETIRKVKAEAKRTRISNHRARITSMIEIMEDIIDEKRKVKRLRMARHHARVDKMVKDMERVAADRQEALDLEAKLARVAELRGMYLDSAFKDWNKKEASKEGKV